MGGNTEHCTMQSEVCKNSILDHTKCWLENDLLMLLCCSEITMALIGKDGHDITQSTQGYRGMQLHMHSNRKKMNRNPALLLLCCTMHMFSAVKSISI